MPGVVAEAHRLHVGHKQPLRVISSIPRDEQIGDVESRRFRGHRAEPARTILFPGFENPFRVAETIEMREGFLCEYTGYFFDREPIPQIPPLIESHRA